MPSSDIQYTNLLTGEKGHTTGSSKSKLTYGLSIVFTIISLVVELGFTVFAFYIAATHKQPSAQNCLMDRYRSLLYAIGSIEIISTIINFAYLCILISEVCCLWDKIGEWLSTAFMMAKFSVFIPLFALLACITGFLYQSPAPAATQCQQVYPEFYSITNYFIILMWTKFGGFLIVASFVGLIAFIIRTVVHYKSQQ